MAGIIGHLVMSDGMAGVTGHLVVSDCKAGVTVHLVESGSVGWSHRPPCFRGLLAGS